MTKLSSAKEANPHSNFESNLRCSIAPEAQYALRPGLWHQSFADWLLTKPVATNFAYQLDDIRDLLCSGVLKYNKFNLADSSVSIKFGDDRLSFIVSNALHFGLETTSGQCAELAFKASMLIRAKYPNLTVLMQEGGSPGFDSHGYNHFFLLAFDGYITNENGAEVHTNEDLAEATAKSIRLHNKDGTALDYTKEGWIIDPSYGVVIPTVNSGYRITCAKKITDKSAEIRINLKPYQAYFIPIAYGENTHRFLDLKLIPATKEIQLRIGTVDSSTVLPFADSRWKEILADDPKLLLFWQNFVKQHHKESPS